METPQLQKATVLKALPPRRDPYWGAPLAKGRHVGFRKLDAARGSWIARMRQDTGSFKFKALGIATPAFQFDQAKEMAQEWFASLEGGVAISGSGAAGSTVEDACKAYVADRKKNSSDANGHDAHMRFKRIVYGTDFGAKPLAKLTTAAIKKWRDDLALNPPTSNRTLTTLKAALNLAVVERRVSANRAVEWANVKLIQFVRERKAVFLDATQKRAMVDAAGEGAFGDLLRAAALTGARPGEIVKAKRRQFDARTQSMTFIGKTSKKVAPRTVPISDAALELFKARAKGVEPDALLFTRDDGQPWAHSDWDQLVRAAATAAKCPKGVTLYSMRHSWITQSLMDGMSTLDVSKLSGTSLKMIEDHYGHLVADNARKRLNAVTLL